MLRRRPAVGRDVVSPHDQARRHRIGDRLDHPIDGVDAVVVSDGDRLGDEQRRQHDPHRHESEALVTDEVAGRKAEQQCCELNHEMSFQLTGNSVAMPMARWSTPSLPGRAQYTR